MTRLLSAAEVPVVELDGDFRVVFQSGGDQPFLVGSSLLLQLPEATRLLAERALHQALAGGGRATFIAKRGARHFRVEVSSIKADASTHLCLVSHDITEDVASSAHRELERERLQIALEATGIGLWSLQILEGTAQWDARMKEITGQDAPPDLLPWLRRATHPDDQQVLDEILVALRRPGPLPSRPLRISRPDGTLRWLLLFGRVTTDEQGRPDAVLGGVLDVTEQQLMAERLRAAQRMEALGHLTAGVAHNFNNMLMVISPCLQQLRDAVSPEHEADVQDALCAAERAADIVRELMTFAGQQNSKEKVIRWASPLCEQTLRLSQRSFPREFCVETNLRSRAAIECAPGAIEQVLSNVIANARDALIVGEIKDPWIGIESEDLQLFGEKWVQITVSDNGPGIPEELRQKVFEPFVTTKTGKGTGLGLASSQALVQQHGGQLACKLRRGGGTAFLILLPCHDRAPERESMVVQRKPAASVAGTILIIEDEPAIRRLVSRGLGKAGFCVETAEDRKTTEDVLRHNLDINLVLLDCTLRQEQGADLLPLLRARLPRAKIYFFTGEPVFELEKAGVEGVVQKPVSLGDLITQILEALQMSPDHLPASANALLASARLR